ncbi:hypothetical protein EGW08_014810 [Elysia chlorotica]|uniref:Uncharacterized protein n=1 Tax=Elysia chlorotica TaxID=188477 RepID=A0A433T750_ELYCH|nr:hypothetical protein EGW08_014810 [Elysia chlorotica]
MRQTVHETSIWHDWCNRLSVCRALVCQGGVRAVSGRCQGGVRVVSGRCQGGVRVVSGWCQDGIRAVSGWCQGGIWAVSGWCRGGVRTVSGWCQGGVRTVLGRCQGGVGAVSGRCQDGFWPVLGRCQDGGKAVSGWLSGRWQGCVRVVSGRCEGGVRVGGCQAGVRAVSERCEGGVRAVSGRCQSGVRAVSGRCREDFSNQVPLADSGMVLQTLHTAAGDTAQYHLDADTAISLAQTQGVKRSEVLPSRSNIDTTNFYPLQAKRGPDMLKMAYEGLERKFDDFALTKPDNESLGGETLFEPAVDRVTPSVPMTWPMLSEIDAEQARKRAPQESKPKKKTKRSPKRVKIRQPWKMDEPKSGAPKLDISHLQKDQKDILAEAAAASQNFVSQARSSVTTRPSSTAPAKLGRDDTSKSYQDLTEEKTNIKEWERTRSASMASLVSKSSKSSRPSLQDQESQEPGPSDQGSED